MMDVGATVLKVGVNKFLEPSSTSTSALSGVNKIGTAAATAQQQVKYLIHNFDVLSPNFLLFVGSIICIWFVS